MQIREIWEESPQSSLSTLSGKWFCDIGEDKLFGDPAGEKFIFMIFSWKEFVDACLDYDMSSSSSWWEHLVSGDSENSAELHRSVVQRQYLAKEGIIYHFSKKAHFFIFNPHPHSQHPGKVQKKLIFPWSLLQMRYFLYFLSSINKMRTHFMALSFLGLNSQTGEERRKLLDDSFLSSEFSFSSRPGRDPFFGKQPRTGSERRGD